MRDGRIDIDALEVRCPPVPSAAEIEQVRRRLHTFRPAPPDGLEAQPFLVITPLGMPWREVIAQSLVELGIAIAGRTPIADWSTASTLVYARTDDDERLRVALAFEWLWRALSPSMQAERWDLANPADLPRLIAAKAPLRARVGTLCQRVSLPGVTLRTPLQVVRLQALHVPDLETVAVESHILRALLQHEAPIGGGSDGARRAPAH
jgi:hypothetical protein